MELERFHKKYLMTEISRTGYKLKLTAEGLTDLKKELTVRGVENALGFRPPSFKVYRSESKGELVVPRYFGSERFGPAATDVRGRPSDTGGFVFTGTLRQETKQPEAFAAGVKAFSEQGGGVLSLPPGFGKTCMALAFSAQLKVRTIIVVHKEFLANQWRDRIKEFCPGATIGRIQQDIWDTEKDFVIAMIQTLCSRELPSENFDQFGFVIVDEAHHIGAAAFSQAMFKFCPKWSLGLTATPERKDGLTRLLYWFMGPEFYRVNRENQKSTRVETIMYDDPVFKEGPPLTRFGKINMAGMTTQITELNSRNKLIIDIIKNCIGDKRRILVLSDRREHCEWIYSQFKNEIAGLYYGGLSEKELEETSKKTVIVATFSMAQEGLDIPVLDTVILTTPHSDITQAIGRIMRETKGKVNSPLIFDIADRWSVCFSMYRKRLKIYKTLGFELSSDVPDEPAAVPLLAECAFI